jgi:hypothetical protein
MNKELIQKLFSKSCWDEQAEVDIEDFISVEKFAELIVRECLNVMSKTSEEANKRFTYMGDDVPTVVHQMNIEHYFGVEQ